MFKRILLLNLFLFSHASLAAVTESATGVLFGERYAFVATAPSGWVLDNQNGVEQGLSMLFYPKSESWPDTSVMVYGRAIQLSESPDIKAQVEMTVADFHANGSPKYKSQAFNSLMLPNGNKAEMYLFSGDKWGNYEAAAYFQEHETINYLVFNARSKADFDQYFNDFMKLASSYQNRYQDKIVLSVDKFANLQREAQSAKDYEAIALTQQEAVITAVKNECVSYSVNHDLPAFSYFAHISPAGRVKESFIYPSSALAVCFNALMLDKTWPEHQLDHATIKINISVLP